VVSRQAGQQVRDSLTVDVVLTRGANGLLYNAVREDGASQQSPLGTRWVEATLSGVDDEALQQLPYATLKQAAGAKMKQVAGKTFVMHMVDANTYVEVSFQQWGSQSDGASYRYRRSSALDTVSQVALASPGDGAMDVAVDSALRWHVDPHASGYDVELTRLSGVTVQVEGVRDTSYRPEALQPGASYQWRVRGVNRLGTGPWSAPWGFTVGGSALDSVRLWSPLDGATEQSILPVLVWGTSAEASQYQVQVSMDGFETALVDELVADTTYRPMALDYRTTYSWRVRGLNATSQGPWSAPWAFSTYAALASPMLLSPSEGQLDVGTQAAFTWSEVDALCWLYVGDIYHPRHDECRLWVGHVTLVPACAWTGPRAKPVALLAGQGVGC